jgi:GR25 family glycosyltransferase involved in LPS biosynthesis
MRPEDVSEVHIINLKTRPDRWVNLTSAIDKCGWPFPQPQRFSAVSGDKVGVPGDYAYQYGGRDIGARGFYEGGGAFGCKQSHVAILQDCLMRDVPSVLILEDDALIAPDFGQQVRQFLAEVPDDWEGIMLGGQHHADPSTIGPNVVKVNYAQRTHAYIARGEYMRELYRRWVHAGAHVDWLMENWQHTQRVYAPVKWLVAQAAGKSDINGRTNPAQSWNDPTGEEPVIHLRAPRHVAEELRLWGLHYGFDRDPETGIDKGLTHVMASGNAEKSAPLRNWVATIQREAISTPGTVATVWHPEVTTELARRAVPAIAKVYNIDADNIADAVAQLPPELNLVRTTTFAHRFTVLLRSSRAVMEQLRGHGFHTGYWRGGDGIDNGLRDVMDLQGPPRADALRQWCASLAREAETIHEGVVTVWHPEATREELEAATGHAVLEIAATSADEVLNAFQRQVAA